MSGNTERIDKVKAAKDRFAAVMANDMLTYEDYRRCVREFFNDPANAEMMIMIINQAEAHKKDLNSWTAFQALFRMMAESEWIMIWTDDKKFRLSSDIDALIGRMS